jgi:hypothetical protein
MSSSTPGQTSTPSSNFQSIPDAALSQALSEYKKKTGKQLLDHPLAAEVQRCDSVDAIITIFQGQAEAFQQFKDGDRRLMKWISPVVDVLYKFSDTLGGAAAIVRPQNPVHEDLKCILTLLCRGPPLLLSSLLGSLSSLLSVSSPPLFVNTLNTEIYRRQKM